MSRHADAALEGHILDAAYALWKKGGEKALTMRAVAKAAKTTTPTVYERFRDKREILESLRRRAQQNLFSVLRGAKVLDDFPMLYLDFALEHKHEYELIHLGWAARFGRNEARPSFEFLKERLARELGGEAAEYTQVALAMAALAHGTASLLHVEGVHASVIESLRDACISGFQAMVEQSAKQRGPNSRGGGASQSVGKRGRRSERAAK
jgi:AcrR family transcriptional regulator